MKVASFNYQMPKHKNFDDFKKYVSDLVESAVKSQAEIILFPEYGSIELVSLLSIDAQKNLQMQLEQLQQFRDKFLKHYSELAKKHNVAIVLPSFPWKQDDGKFVNRAYVVSESGVMGYQEKNMMTRFENEDWHVSKGEGIQKVFEYKGIKFSINICYDVEFPDFAREVCAKGVKLILAPSCTETLRGLTRVHVGARARALENQCYVVVSQTILNVDYSEAIDFNTGRVAFYSTPDDGFPDEGILAISEINQACHIVYDLDFSLIDNVRSSGKVFNFNDIKKIPNS